MTLKNLTREKAVIHTAAQLLLQGFPEEEVLGGLSEDEIEAVHALVEIRQQELHEATTEVAPPALVADTEEWRQRRKDLGITE